jgi:UDP-2,3-diacylglucosamine pyrophosphatase LpxH
MTPSITNTTGKEVPLDRKYYADIKEGLDRAFEAAGKPREIPREKARIVVLSDHHKGVKDGADDFHKCEPAYCAALGHYLEAGYELFVLGDVEELWENDAAPVLKQYPEVLKLEAEFHRLGRYTRFWGNHDDVWSHEKPRKEHLDPILPGIEVRESLGIKLTQQDGPPGLLFLAHGHQGTDDSDRFRFIARPVVRYIWRPIQRKTGYTGNTPASDFNLRAKHDRAMYEWARQHPEKPVLIAGHTHRPVFWTDKPELPRYRDPKVVEGLLDELRRDDPDSAEIPTLRAELEFGRAALRNPKDVFAIDPPCYFNTGCCSFGDGDVTGLEIADDEIRLVRWPDNDGAPQRLCLAKESLGDVLAAVRKAADPRAREVEVRPTTTMDPHAEGARR